MKIIIILIASFVMIGCGEKVTPLSNPSMLPSIRAGFNKAITAGRCEKYLVNLTLRDVKIVIKPSEIYKGREVFRVPISPEYRNSEFDRGGYIYAAGQFFPPNVIWIPASGIPENTKESVYNEMEHLLLYKYDRNRYEKTKLHLNNNHPIFKDCTN